MAEATILFCEEYRQEAHGKFSLLGMFAGYLGVSVPEYIMPRLCVVALIKLKRQTDGPKLTLTLRLGDEVLASQEGDLKLLEDAPLPPPGAPSDEIWLSVPLQGTNVMLRAGLSLHADLLLGDVRIASSSLAIVSHKPE